MQYTLECSLEGNVEGNEFSALDLGELQNLFDPALYIYIYLSSVLYIPYIQGNVIFANEYVLLPLEEKKIPVVQINYFKLRLF